MTDSCEGGNCKRSSCPCKQERLNISEESHLTPDSNEGVQGDAYELSARRIGEDGSYFDCDIYHDVGTLLCCDTCPSTFHLQCLKPPLKRVPSGSWQCQKCCPRAYSFDSKSLKQSASFSKVKHAPSGSILSLDENQLNESSYVHVDPKSRSSAADQKLPPDSLHSLDKLAEAGDVLGKPSKAFADSKDQEKSFSHISDEIGTQSGTKMGELKVYRRSTWNKKVRTEQGANSRKSSEVASDKVNEDHKDKPVHNPVEIDGKPVEEQGEAVVTCQAINERPYSGSLNVNQQDKLWILRDVMEASANGHCFSQNNESRDSQMAAHLGHEESCKVLREKWAKLRARQKERIAQRVKVGEIASGSGPFRAAGFVQLHRQNLTGYSGPSNKYSGIDAIRAIPLRMLRPEDAEDERTYQSSDKIDVHKNSFEDLRVKSHLKRSNCSLEGFGDQFPGFPTLEAPEPDCLTTVGVKHQKMGISPLLSTSSVPQARDGYPRKGSTSDFFSGFPMASMGHNNSRMMDVDVSWSGKELDCLWVGVRRHGQASWEQMLTDPNLCFSKGKTAKDLAEMWNKEKAKHFGPRVATTDKPDKGKRKMIDIDLNVELSFESWLLSDSSGKEKSDEPVLLFLGGYVEIPKFQTVSGAGGDGANQMQMQEAEDISPDSEATISN